MLIRSKLLLSRYLISSITTMSRCFALSSTSNNKQCFADTKSLVSAEEALAYYKDNLSGGAKFIDASWHLNKSRNAQQEFLLQRIPGSVFFDIEDISDKLSPFPHMLPSESVFEEKVSSLGINSDEHLFVYANAGAFSAARVWWTFRAFGHNRVSVINGGLSAWLSIGGPTESGPLPSIVPSSGNFKAILNKNMVVDSNYVLQVVNSGTAQILDARSRARFLAQAPEPRPGLPGGHIPGSLSLPFTALVADDDVTQFRSMEDIKTAFEDAGLIFGSKAVLSCGSGVSAAVLCLGLDIIGQNISTSAPIYDGSWTEWASTEGLPILK